MMSPHNFLMSVESCKGGLENLESNCTYNGGFLSADRTPAKFHILPLNGAELFILAAFFHGPSPTRSPHQPSEDSTDSFYYG